ncbi:MULTISPECIES: TPM domain-containing protein [Flavobacterium]|uniref:TPM domain-containing protein n=1 Tax=Flavobacterium jumunjinense TaxID=998845 RepID=A0ABV5GS60_9FLAO|nr:MULTISPECIES: TPM domain-containing protein [Flavobacterium]
MSKTEDFLTASEEQEIVQAIVAAEKDTSGEIRVHIEEHSEKPPLERAQEVFFSLEMQNTKERNGVLFYVGVTDKQFAILGDEGINKVVGDDFWNSTKDIVLKHFKNKNNKDGLVNGIIEAGKRLKTFFPYQSDDTNELPNEISRG